MTAPTDTPRVARYAKTLRSVAGLLFSDTVTAEELREAATLLESFERELAAALAEVKRLNEWADGMTDAALKERQTGEMYQRELRAEIERLRQHQDELARRVAAVFYEPGYVNAVIARVRAEMEKEKGNG